MRKGHSSKWEHEEKKKKGEIREQGSDGRSRKENLYEKRSRRKDGKERRKKKKNGRD